MKRALPAIALVALAGCTTVGPDYKRPDVTLPSGFEGRAAAPAAPLPAQWWRLYSDPLLGELVGAALASNADLRLAAARVLEAEGVWREARASLFPEVTGGFSYSNSRISTQTAPPPFAGLSLVRP